MIECWDIKQKILSGHNDLKFFAQITDHVLLSSIPTVSLSPKPPQVHSGSVKVDQNNNTGK